MKTPNPPTKPPTPRPRSRLAARDTTSSIAPVPPPIDTTPGPREMRVLKWLRRSENPHER